MLSEHIGYVVKVYPRFSETFVVTEILAREAAGEQISIFALRPTTDARFHPELARVQAPVTHLPRPHRLFQEWDVIARAQRELPDFGTRYGELMPLLVKMEPSDVVQGIDLALRVQAAGITHLHVHFATAAARAATIASALTGVPFTVTTHAKDLFHESVDPELLKGILNRATNVIAISDYNRRFLTEQVDPALAERVRLVNNGLELERFAYRDPVAPRDPMRVLAVGRLVEKKGFCHLIEAAAELTAAGQRLEVRIVGDGDLADELAAQVTELGLGGVVELTGPLSQSELIGQLDWADVMVAPCIVGADGNADGLPTVLLEAMATGVVCVATDVTGIPEAIHDGTGILLSQDPAGLSAAVADALRQVADPGFDRVAVARAARAKVEESFDTRKQTAKLRELESPRRATQQVAYVCADPGIPVFGRKGASVHVQEIVRAWRSRGAEVTIYTTRRGDDVPADLADVDVVVVPVGKSDDPAVREQAQQAAAAKIAELVVEAAPDVVYERYSLFSRVLERVAAAQPATMRLLEVNAPLVEEQRDHRVLVDEPAARAAIKAQASAAHVVACVSAPVADWVREQLGRHDDKVIVAPNGVNTDRIQPVTPDLSGDAVVTFVGTLKPWHGVELLLDAAARASQPWQLRLIGDGPERESLEARAAELGIKADFLGAIAPESVPEALAGSLVAVAPYPASDDHYFSPLKVYEYSAAALPVVASGIGQIPEIVTDRETGLIVPPSDPDALAAAIDSLIADPQLAQQLGAAGRERMVANHHWNRVLDATVAPAQVG